MDNTLFAIACLIEIGLGLLTVAVTRISKNSAEIHESIDSLKQTTAATRPQWGAIIEGIIGANAGYLLLVGSFMIVMKSQAVDDVTVELLIAAAWVSYLCLALPAYLGMGAITGLLINRYATKKSLTNRAGMMLNLAVSTGLGALLGVPIYFVGMIAAAL